MDFNYTVTLRYTPGHNQAVDSWTCMVRGGTVGEAMEAACGRFERSFRHVRGGLPEIVGITVDKQ